MVPPFHQGGSQLLQQRYRENYQKPPGAEGQSRAMTLPSVCLGTRLSTTEQSLPCHTYQTKQITCENENVKNSTYLKLSNQTAAPDFAILPFNAGSSVL